MNFVDKKKLLRKSLAIFLKKYLQSINNAVLSHPVPIITMKSDGTPVTQLDLTLSLQLEDLFYKEFPSHTFYSEEKFSDWKFPLIALDPLDGTREYIDGRDEWAISVGVFENENFEGEGWVYNPKTSELFSSELLPRVFSPKSNYIGEVSRSEWNKGLFINKNNDQFNLVPVGSIAYKLGRLAIGKSDFVVSLYPKSIWDIAGGSLLCKQSGIKFYSQGKEVKNVLKRYEPPLIWCHEELYSSLSKIFP